MSRIGKLPIEIVEGVKLTEESNKIVVAGKIVALEVAKFPEFDLEISDTELKIIPRDSEIKTKQLWGLYRTLINNAIIGVTTGFEKKLEIRGVGFKVSKTQTGLNLSLGFSHDVAYTVPEGVTADIEGLIITIKSADKQLVGQVASEIRALKVPEPYKGKGIRYIDEVVKIKAGKVAKVG